MYYSYNELYHHGIKGQRWGVRRFQNEDGTRISAGKTREKKSVNTKKLKTAAKIAGATLTIAACSALYLKNKKQIDTIVKNTITLAKNKNQERKDNYFKNNRDKILKDPGKILKYKDKFTEKEVGNAIKEMKQLNTLHQLKQENISRGAKYAQSFLLYGTALTGAYSLTKSPLAQDIKRSSKKKMN